MDAASISAAADSVTALSALSALIVGVRSAHDWRKQKRHEKAAEVAGQVLGACLLALDGLELVFEAADTTSIYQLAMAAGPVSEGQSQAMQRQLNTLANLLSSADPSTQHRVAEMQKAVALAMTYFPESVWLLVRQIESAAFRGLPPSVGQLEVERLRREILKELGPFARFESSKQS